MNKKNILKILITIILIIIFSVFVFKNNNQKIENDAKNQKQEKTVENKTTKIEKENNENKQKVLLKNIQFGNKKIDVVEDKNEKDENNVDITKLIIRDKETGENILLEKFEATNFVPVEIIDTFLYESRLKHYIIVLTESYSKNVDNPGDFYKGIYIYDTSNEQVYGLEKYLYKIDLKSKKEILLKLKELTKKGKL